MDITIISEENIHDYMQILTTDEIFGISDGRFISFAVSEDKSSEPVGVMSVQILPEYIRLERIFVLPEERRKGYASGLLEIIKDRPEGAQLPICAFLENEKDVRALLEKSGFAEQECDYSVIEGHLSDWVDMESRIKKVIPEDVVRKMKIRRLSQMPLHAVREYILESPHDEILQFPDKTMDLERFSDASMFCLTDGAITAASMIEETEDNTQFTWCYGKDIYSVYVSIFMVKREIEPEYGADYRIRCLCPDEKSEQAYGKLFSKYDRIKIDMFKFD